MQRSGESARVQGWVDAMDDTMREAQVGDQKQVEALAHWFDVSNDRQEGRRARLAESKPFVPDFLWAALILISIVVLGYQLLMIDPKVRVVGQAYSMAAMAITVFAALAVVYMVDRPFNDRGAAIPHTRMSAALERDGTHRPRHPPLRRTGTRAELRLVPSTCVPGTQLARTGGATRAAVRVGGGRRSPRPRARGCGGTAPRWGGGTSRRALPRRSPPGRGPTPPG